MRFNTKSHDNVAIGSGALAAHNLTDNSSGGNVAIGYSAGLIVSTGTQNTLIGGLAGDAITGGAQNTIVGYNAGGATTGTLNAFYGRSSGSAMTSGTKNSIIGSYNGNQNSLDLRTADNSIIISNGDGHPIINYQIAPDAIRMRGQTNGVNRLGVQGTLGMTNGATFNVTVGNSGAQIIHIYDTGSGAGAVYFSNYAAATSIIASNGSVSFGTAASAEGYNLYKSNNSHAATFQNNSGQTRNIQINVIGCAVSD